MNAQESFQQRLDAIARYGFGAGIAYVAVIYSVNGLWSKPLSTPAWIGYLVVAGCIAALFASRRVRIAAFVVAAASTIGLLAIEAPLEVYRLRQDAAWLSLVAVRSGAVSAAPGQQALARRAAEAGVRGIRCPALAIQAADRRLLPLSGWPDERTLLGNELGYDAIYLADRFGFNNPNETYDVRDGRARVVILGDSFAHGVAVRPEANAAAALRRRGFHVLNLGCAGNGPLAELAAYREYGSRFEPDIVVWFYLESNDLSDLARESRSLLAAYLQPGFTQGLVSRSGEIVDFLDRLPVPSYRPQQPLLRIARFVNTRGLLSRLVTSQRELVDKLRAVTASLQREVTADGARLVVIYLPDPAALARASRQRGCFYSSANCKAEVLGVFAGQSIPVLDFGAVLGRRDDPLSVFSYRLGREARGHYTEAGYALLGESIADELQRLGH